MLKRVIGLLGIAWFVGPAAVAQQGIDPALIERGQLLYEINCVLCHKESGEGGVPMFPALDGNEQLGDALRIVASISQGSGVMPPFPDLIVEDITALAKDAAMGPLRALGQITFAMLGQMISVSSPPTRLLRRWRDCS